MAFKVSFRFTGPSNVNNDFVVNSSDNTYNRLMAMAQEDWGPVDNGSGGTRPLTENEVFKRVTQEMTRGMNTLVKNYEARKAISEIPPIDATEG